VPATHATATSYAVQQTWNSLLQAAGVIYPTYYKAGYTTDACGQWYGQPASGLDMSQYGSQACAVADNVWAQTINRYYFPNPTYTGDHIYGQWHGATSWGPVPWWPVSTAVSAGPYTRWKFKAGNSCGQPLAPFDYGSATDFKFIGDWDGNGTFPRRRRPRWGVASLESPQHRQRRRRRL
jgi:hypothetical protein